MCIRHKNEMFIISLHFDLFLCVAQQTETVLKSLKQLIPHRCAQSYFNFSERIYFNFVERIPSPSFSQLVRFRPIHSLWIYLSAPSPAISLSFPLFTRLIRFSSRASHVDRSCGCGCTFEPAVFLLRPRRQSYSGARDSNMVLVLVFSFFKFLLG